MAKRQVRPDVTTVSRELVTELTLIQGSLTAVCHAVRRAAVPIVDPPTDHRRLCLVVA